jgi:hypothetical protein
MELQSKVFNDHAFQNRRAFEAGNPEKLLLHGRSVTMHPPEVLAFEHGRNPDSIKFLPTPKRRAKDYIPVSIRPDEAWCTGCRQYHHVDKFHKDKSRGRRGLQYNCIDYRAAQRIVGPRKKEVSEHWYRS